MKKGTHIRDEAMQARELTRTLGIAAGQVDMPSA